MELARLTYSTIAIMTTDSTPATVLVVDDEEAYVDAYATWIGERYRVKTATSGESAIEQLDTDVDVVLLDRRMPGLSGDEVLRTIRNRGFDCRVAMITAVEPDFDIVGMGFDEYLVKPVSRKDLFDVVETLLTRAEFDARVQECFSLVSKKTALESVMDPDQLRTADEYRRLKERIDQIESRMNETLDDLIDRGKVAAAYYDIES